MNSRRRHEGYLIIDHRAGMGLTDEEAHQFGAPPVGHGKMMELPTITCRHCQKVVIINPSRTRERAYCPKCDHYICDWCEAERVALGGECKLFDRLADNVLNEAAKGKSVVATAELGACSRLAVRPSGLIV